MPTPVIACGAPAGELRDLKAAHDLDSLTSECLPASLHNHPGRMPAADRIERVRNDFDRIRVGYADSGTGGALDRTLSVRNGGRRQAAVPESEDQ